MGRGGIYHRINCDFQGPTLIGSAQCLLRTAATVQDQISGSLGIGTVILSPETKFVLAIKNGRRALHERVKPVGLLAHPVQPLEAVSYLRFRLVGKVVWHKIRLR
jgi:hypothetical protein